MWKNKQTGEVVTVGEVYEERIGGMRIRCVELTNGYCWTAAAFVAQHERI